MPAFRTAAALQTVRRAHLYTILLALLQQLTQGHAMPMPPCNISPRITSSINNLPSHPHCPIAQQQLQQLPTALARRNVQRCLAVAILSSEQPLNPRCSQAAGACTALPLPVVCMRMILVLDCVSPNTAFHTALSSCTPKQCCCFCTLSRLLAAILLLLLYLLQLVAPWRTPICGPQQAQRDINPVGDCCCH
jgi:hypothetical protein